MFPIYKQAVHGVAKTHKTIESLISLEHGIFVAKRCEKMRASSAWATI